MVQQAIEQRPLPHAYKVVRGLKKRLRHVIDRGTLLV
jgi:hypothetical protein